MTTRSVFRLHIRSTIDHVVQEEAESFCLDNGWAGMGWGIWDETPSGLSWPQYTNRKTADDGAVNSSVRTFHDLAAGALVWTRGKDGVYWLGEIRGDWEYHGDDSAKRLDLFNRRRCTWVKAGPEDVVPGKIVSNFRAPKTLNRVADGPAARYTRKLFGELTGTAEADDSPTAHEVVRTLLGAEDLEDLVAAYLQDRHDLVLVARGRSTPGYEYVLRGRRSGRKAVCSVKSGGSAVELDRLPASDEIDAFAYGESWCGAARDDIEWIEETDLVTFIHERREVLPDQVRYWLGVG